MAELLSLENVVAGYGDAIVLEGVSLSFDEGSSLAVLGRNGVGKTTLLMTLIGLTTLHAGAIHWRGKDLAALPVHARASAGLGWVPQERGMFPSLTVHEHLTVVARPGRWNADAIYGLFPALERRRDNLGSRLSGGEQQMLAIARALMLNPSLLLLDEPTEGLAPIIVQELGRIIRSLVEESGMALILVEQHARLALSLTENAIVLERGRIAHRSTSRELLQNEELLHQLVAVRPDPRKGAPSLPESVVVVVRILQAHGCDGTAGSKPRRRSHAAVASSTRSGSGRSLPSNEHGHRYRRAHDPEKSCSKCAKPPGDQFETRRSGVVPSSLILLRRAG
jgi:branched-chain amino acid transport system ATP-binding protein